MGVHKGISDEFLLDEVRCGFVVPSAMKQAWAAELEVLMEIDRVCKKHSIQYFADWGTLLGAVRHGGFIPWDDDLDIVMKRKDYEKFMSVARFDMAEGFDVQTFRNQKDFWLFMGKVVGRNHFCFEKEHLRRFHNFPYIACVDIFVLDYVYRDGQKEEERRYLCKYMLGVADAIVEGRLTPEEKHRNLQRLQQMSGLVIPEIADPVEMGRYLYGEIEKLFAKVPEKDADTLTQLFPWGLKGDRFHFPKEYYETSVELPFECTTIPVPFAYDRMLKLRYGDYMKLIRNAGAHDYPFFEGQKANLQKVLDFPLPEFIFQKELLYRDRTETESREYSYKVMAKSCMCELRHMWEQLIGEKLLVQQALKLVSDSQQLAVDLGTMLEQMIGEHAAIISLLEEYCEVLYLLYERLIRSTEQLEPDGIPAGIEQPELDGRTAGIEQPEPNGMQAGIEQSEAESLPVQKQLNEELRRLECLLDQISSELERIVVRKTVLFLPVMAKDWKTLQPLWQAAMEDTSCDASVVPLPYYYKDYDGSAKELLCESGDFSEELAVREYNILTPEYLEMLHPEVIVIQNPYDAWNPAVSVAPAFYSEKLRKYTDCLVYVPPFTVEEYTGQNHRAYLNMKYYTAVPGMVYADRILVQSENMRELYLQKMMEFAGEETQDIWKQRILAMESIGMITAGVTSQGRSTEAKRKLLYGISLGVYLGDKQAMNRKIADNLRIFEEHRGQIEVTVCLFPWGDAKWQEFRGEIPDLPVRAPEECAVEEFDAYYGDAMPKMTEFSQAKKPVMLQNVEVMGV